MVSVSGFALRAAFLLGCSAALTSVAQAQAPAAAPRTFNLSKTDRAVLNPIVTAIRAGNYAGAQAALSSARSAAISADARYLVAAEQLRLGIATNNNQLQAEAIDTMIASGLADPSQMPQLLLGQASLATSAGNRRKAENALTRLLEMAPNDPAALEALARLRTDNREYGATVRLVDRMIDRQRAAGQPVSEGLYKYGLNYATMSKSREEAMKFSQNLVAAYPSARNWRDVLLTYRDMARPDPATELDAWRLMRLNKSLAGERDYLLLADMLNRDGKVSEAKAVLDEAVSGNMLDSAKAATLRKTVNPKAAAEAKTLAAKEKAALAAATGSAALAIADIYFGRGEYAKAVPLYQAALQKGSVDAAQVNTRLGMALAMTGQKAAADAAFRSVTGPRAELAAFLQLWLAQRA
jgi:tetratricopeptide (TPR) repeat protein